LTIRPVIIDLTGNILSISVKFWAINSQEIVLAFSPHSDTSRVGYFDTVDKPFKFWNILVTENNTEGSWLSFDSNKIGKIFSDGDMSWSNVQFSRNSGIIGLAREDFFVFKSDSSNDKGSFGADCNHLRFVTASKFGSTLVPRNFSVSSIDEASEDSFAHFFSMSIFHAANKIGWAIENSQFTNGLSFTSSDFDETS
jgi:hypothetical protein